MLSGSVSRPDAVHLWFSRASEVVGQFSPTKMSKSLMGQPHGGRTLEKTVLIPPSTGSTRYLARPEDHKCGTPWASPITRWSRVPSWNLSSNG